MLDKYPELESIAVVPLGISRFNNESSMRLHTLDEANAVLDAVHDWQDIFLRVLGRRMAFAADEYYLMTGRPFPDVEAYEGFAMHEDGIGMARTFHLEFNGLVEMPTGVQSGFFAAVDTPPPNPAAYTGLRSRSDGSNITLSPRRNAPIGVLTGEFGALVVGPLIESLGRSDVRVIPVVNEFFGGNTAVTGLMVGADIGRVLADQPVGHRYLIPDVCLSEGRFLDGTTPADLPRPVEVVATDGLALRAALEPAT